MTPELNPPGPPVKAGGKRNLPQLGCKRSPLFWPKCSPFPAASASARSAFSCPSHTRLLGPSAPQAGFQAPQPVKTACTRLPCEGEGDRGERPMGLGTFWPSYLAAENILGPRSCDPHLKRSPQGMDHQHTFQHGWTPNTSRSVREASCEKLPSV